MQVVIILLNALALLGALVWWYKDKSLEPMVTSIGLIATLAALLFRANKERRASKPSKKSINSQSVQQTVNVYGVPATSKPDETKQEREHSLSEKKNRIRILFIDDDTKFKVVSILKSNGWINTWIVKDAMVDDDVVVQSDIIFVDIQGVGKLMQCKDEGLGLAMQIKRKYSSKWVVLYSAESHGDRFHAALKEVDSSLPKNAEPFEFLELIEQFCRK
ncbi:MAG: response regulator [Flavobacteriales bacterium]|nr:response regulator [Flavobacteriales bacterium]